MLQISLIWKAGQGALRLILSNGDGDAIRELSAVVDDEELTADDDAPKIVQDYVFF